MPEDSVVLAFILLQTSTAQSNPIMSVLPLVLMFAIMYFLLILPMQRQRKKTSEMLGALKNGDVVQTSGGLIGSIVSLADDIVVIRVKPDNVKLQVARSAVSGVVGAEEKK